ncbi:MBL fold metallo-hydrolase [Arthrobacter bambusae]|uniref:MBL fold metallo-hydrolase n=1 Tax=Arthrobacter bambusae TaxID=1338426 RepID=UPI00277F6CB3|nr:MBL fold metallo-hydrolase [Arthrobacter bambusae]MDQ0031325.1 glyoxylase-like metal-dependent hydrolase (beta-lactamase superfamily II)/rhodanese-related sulfurtransferase [Arthrobacter bambusae]MDQ0099548.1 glyoxylase-like metal-dependent hydrolase (beta-lactamase superfamily II)/rhodanese-related sulfurtransferase [Arthrobacter bambusae]
MDVVVIETTQLGDRSYLVHDGKVALVIDPQRDTDRVETAARNAGVTITHVAETHLHNDYLTGGLILAREHNARYLVNAADKVAFEREPVVPGQTFKVGRLSVKPVATPGHTHTHLAYVVSDPDAGSAADAGTDAGTGVRQAVFSGGSLLYGSVGRTDLIGPGDTAGLAHDQYASVRRLVAEAAPDAILYPTHGFGSFCSIGPASKVSVSTLGQQGATNHALTDPDEDHFVRHLLASITAYPSYYAHMSPLNARGPEPALLDVPESVESAELERRLAAGEWVVDLRNRVAFAASHLRGSVAFEYGTGSSFTSYLGWVLPWNQPLTLLGAHDDVEKAIRDLARIGFDSPDAAVGQDPGALAPSTSLVQYPVTDWAGLVRDRAPGETVLDVRRTEEFAASHVSRAMNVPLHELLRRMDELPNARIWVHCASGYRASVAASLLHRVGRDVVLIDAPFREAADAGVELRGAAAPK